MWGDPKGAYDISVRC